MKKIVLAVFGLIIALLISGHIVLKRFAVSWEEQAKSDFAKKTGWTVSTDAPAEINALFSPSVRFSNILLKAPEGEASVRINGLKAELAFFPLLFGKVRPLRVFLSDIAGKSLSLRQIDFNAPFLTLDFNPEDVSLSGEAITGSQRLTVSGKADTKLTKFDVTLTGEKSVITLRNTPDGKLAAQVTATDLPIAEKPTLELSAIINAPLSSSPEVPFFSLTLGNMATAEGSVSSFDPIVFSLKASGVFPLRKNEKVDFDLNIEKNADSLSVPHLRFKSALSDITKASFFKSEGEHPSLSVRLDAEKLTLRDMLFLMSLAKKGAAGSPDRSKKLFSPEKFDLARIRTFKADADIRAKEIVSAAGKGLGPMVATGKIADGVLSDFRFTVSDTVAAQAVWKASDNGSVETSFRLTMKNMPAELISPQNEYESGLINGTVRWKAAGFSPKEAAESMNGKIYIVGKDLISSKERKQVSSKVTDIISTLKIPDKVSCFVVNTPIANGVLTSDNRIATETNVYNAQLNGSVDFGNDKINMTFSLMPKQTDFISSMLTKIGITGKVSDPKITLNTEASLQNALIYGLSFLKGGKKLAQEAVKLEEPRDVCREALRK